RTPCRSRTASQRAGRSTPSRDRPALAIVNLVNDMQTPIASDTVEVADALRPVLLRVGRELRREARAEGISPEQVSLLVAVKYSPGIGIRDLATHERISAPALTKHIDRLERDHLVLRTPGVDDRRRIGLALTDEGQ